MRPRDLPCIHDGPRFYDTPIFAMVGHDGVDPEQTGLFRKP
jgi:hypothetical protein